jgi:hypothetical protein
MRAMAEVAPVTVVTLFSAAGPPPHTRAARTFLRQCGASDAATLFAQRRAEDVAVLDGLGVRHVHLGHPDALFRRRRDPSGLLRRAGRVLPELDHRYPTFRFDIDLGRLSRGDRELREEITEEVAARARNASVFAPLGVGRHVDRLLARSVASTCGPCSMRTSPTPPATRMLRPRWRGAAALGLDGRPRRQGAGHRGLPDAGGRAVPDRGDPAAARDVLHPGVLTTSARTPSHNCLVTLST